MLDVVLFQPEIPPNTGNVIRLCANTGFALHLIEPLGFELDDAKLRRAGLDYHEWATVTTWRDFPAYLGQHPGQRVFAFSTRGATRFDRAAFRAGDALLFGPETRGLPQAVLDALPREHVLRLPMRQGSRSMNLSNTVAVAVFEAWRQLGYEGGG